MHGGCLDLDELLKDTMIELSRNKITGKIIPFSVYVENHCDNLIIKCG